MRRCLFALLLALLLIPTAAQAAVTEDGLWYAEPDEFRETAESSKDRVVGKLTRTDNPMISTQKLENAGIRRKI